MQELEPAEEYCPAAAAAVVQSVAAVHCIAPAAENCPVSKIIDYSEQCVPEAQSVQVAPSANFPAKHDISVRGGLQ